MHATTYAGPEQSEMFHLLDSEFITFLLLCKIVRIFLFFLTSNYVCLPSDVMQRWRNVDDDVIRSIPNFREYSYDANDESRISDGGNDMYDGGNEVSS